MPISPEDMSQWRTVADELPPRGRAVVRYGQSIFGPYIDIGEILNKDGFRWADWGVTHWRPIVESDMPDKWEKLSFLPEEYEFLCKYQERCACGHMIGFHQYSGDGEGFQGCILQGCNCLEGYACFS